MCNHYANDPDAQAKLSTWREYIGWSLDDDWPGGETDIWPRRSAMVIVRDDDRTAARSMHWGVPLTMPGKRPGSTVTKHITNVRNLKSPFWRSMLSSPAQRCLVPFTSFAEPKIGQGRAEHWFSLPSRPVACFAGIWRESDAGQVYAFLTCEPNPLVAPLHPKAMPVILDEADHELWLTGTYDQACALAVPYPSQLMKVE
ncbi:MAG: SOS response-associated peptidase family protein [Blastomonas sp.]